MGGVSRSFFGQMPEMPWRKLRELAAEIHQNRLGTPGTLDDCLGCWNMARGRLGMPEVERKDKPYWHSTPSGLIVPNKEAQMEDYDPDDEFVDGADIEDDEDTLVVEDEYPFAEPNLDAGGHA